MSVNTGYSSIYGLMVTLSRIQFYFFPPLSVSIVRPHPVITANKNTPNNANA